MITVKGLKKSFGQLEVLKGIDQHITPGEKVVIIGPSGSGKSTFLRCLNLLERPTEGQILFEGTDITDPKCDINLIRRRMGMVFQQFNLFPHLTVMQNLTLAPIQTGQMSKEAATERPPSCWRAWVCWRRRAYIPSSFPADSSSASPLCAPFA